MLVPAGMVVADPLTHHRSGAVPRARIMGLGPADPSRPPPEDAVDLRLGAVVRLVCTPAHRRRRHHAPGSQQGRDDPRQAPPGDARPRRAPLRAGPGPPDPRPHRLTPLVPIRISGDRAPSTRSSSNNATVWPGATRGCGRRPTHAVALPHTGVATPCAADLHRDLGAGGDWRASERGPFDLHGRRAEIGATHPPSPSRCWRPRPPRSDAHRRRPRAATLPDGEAAHAVVVAEHRAVHVDDRAGRRRTRTSRNAFGRHA